MEFTSYIKDFKQSLQSQLSEFVFKTTDFINEMQQQQNEMKNLQNDLTDKQNEISNYHKVSFVKQLNKQLEQQKKDTNVFKLRNRSLQKRIQNLEKKIKQLKKGFYDTQEIKTIFDTISQKRISKANILQQVEQLKYLILDIEPEPVKEPVKDPIQEEKKEPVKEPVKIESESEEEKEEPVKEVVEESVKEVVEKHVEKNYEETNEEFENNNISYTIINYKKKQFYLDKTSNNIYRKKKSGKVGKEYGYIKNNLVNKKI